MSGRQPKDPHAEEPTLESVVQVLYQKPERDPKWFYQRVACPLFRNVPPGDGKRLVEKNTEFDPGNLGSTKRWRVRRVEATQYLAHKGSGKQVQLKTGHACVLLQGLVGIQAGATVNGDPVTLLSSIVTPGELLCQFGAAGKYGGSRHKGDELAAVFALTDSWILEVPFAHFYQGTALTLPASNAEPEKQYLREFVWGLAASLFEVISTNRVIERRLAGAPAEIRFVATMLAIVARHGYVEGSPDLDSDWCVQTSFHARGQFFKGLARLRESDTKWRQELHMEGVVEIPARNTRGALKLWPKKLIIPKLWQRLVDDAAKRGDTDGGADWQHRLVCRNAAYSAYRAADRPHKEELAGLDLEADSVSSWNNYLVDVLPRRNHSSVNESSWMG